MTLKSFQIFWFCVWKCEKECVKVCDNLKSWIPSHRHFHRYFKLQKQTYIAKVMTTLSYSQIYIFHTDEIVKHSRIAIWGLRSALIKMLKRTDPHYFFLKTGVCFLQLFDPRHGLVSNCNMLCATISRVIFSWFWPLKIKKSQKKLYGHNPLGIFNHISF